MLKVCLNGARSGAEHPRLPITPAQVAVSAVDAVAAGAAMVHVHPRGVDGRESFAVDDVVATCLAIRAAIPGMRVSVTTRDGVLSATDEKLRAIAQWPAPEFGGPDAASVNWHEHRSTEIADLLADRGIGVEAGLWTPAATATFVASGWSEREDIVERILIEVIPGISPLSDGPQAAERIASALGRVRIPVLIHGEGDWTWPTLFWALESGYDSRIGFEDTLAGPDGQYVRDNAEMVRHALSPGSERAMYWPVQDPMPPSERAHFVSADNSDLDSRF